jgi:SNF2 family DNA or RNA helicase
MPRANLLIADDVGLGKTIEAGLVVQELLIRQRARSVLVVCPSSLQIQWRDQMRDKFGLEFRIVDSDLLHRLRRERGLHVTPGRISPGSSPRSTFLKRDRPLRLMGAALSAGNEPTYPRRFDMLIVDEAHNVAPAGRSRYAIDSLRTAAVRRLAPHFEHKLFLSATPHNGYPESFTALLELVDNQRFARGVRPDPEPEDYVPFPDSERSRAGRPGCHRAAGEGKGAIAPLTARLPAPQSRVSGKGPASHLPGCAVASPRGAHGPPRMGTARQRRAGHGQNCPTTDA